MHGKQVVRAVFVNVINEHARVSSPYLENNGNNEKNGRNQTEIVTPLYDEFNGTRGYNEPRDCVARQRTAVIIPYRNRQEQLDQLLAHLNPILKRQLISYQVSITPEYLFRIEHVTKAIKF